MNLAILLIDCSQDDSALFVMQDSLSPLIQARANRYRDPLARRNLIVTQTRLHQAIHALKIQPHDLTIASNGRPYHRDQKIQFNLSHSKDRAVLALSFDLRLKAGLGIDLESIGRPLDHGLLASRFFTPKEASLVAHDPLCFFWIWTRKEAVLKSSGLGLRVRLDAFEVLEDQVEAGVTGEPLTLKTFPPDQGYIMSLATHVTPAKIKFLSDQDPNWCSMLAEYLYRSREGFQPPPSKPILPCSAPSLALSSQPEIELGSSSPF